MVFGTWIAQMIQYKDTTMNDLWIMLGDELVGDENLDDIWPLMAFAGIRYINEVVFDHFFCSFR